MGKTMVKRLFLLAISVLALLSCENPIQAGLGSKVDITHPTIAMVEPAHLGDHVKGTFPLTVNALDDVAVDSVWIAVTVDANGSPLDPAAWNWIPATFNPDTQLWYGAVDTLPYPDGDLPIKVRAVDGTNKETVFDGVYVVKNLPPTIEVQVPSEPDTGKMRELVAGGFMMGVATDPWGVAPGYPLIQFWPSDKPAPDPESRSNWDVMDKPDYSGAWKEIVNNPGEREALSKKAMEFRYRAVDHKDTAVPPRSLDPGYYRYRFQVMDAAGDVFRYPPAGTDPDYFELTIIRGNEDPKIVFHPLENYQKGTFAIKADISHSLGINQAELRVQREGVDESVLLARKSLGDHETLGEGEAKRLQRTLESFDITAGLYNYADAAAPPLEAEEYEFKDGAYDFTVTAYSNQGSEASQTYRVYIDTTPPEITVSQVEDAFEVPAAGVYTVNGVVRVAIGNPLEENGLNHVDGPTSPREIKYLITTTPFPAGISQAELESHYNSVSGYFDEVVDTSSPRVFYPAGKYNNIVIDTTSLNDTPYYLYVIAKDRAGNYGHTGVTLNVDQATDLPRVAITAFNINIRSDTDHGSSSINPNSLNSLTSGRTISGTITDDDGIDPASITFNYDDYAAPTGPHPLTDPAFNVNPSNPKQVTFTALLPDTLPDGNYTLEIKAQDDASNTTGKNRYLPARDGGDLSEANFSTTDPITFGRTFFIIDTTAPILKETEIGDDATHFSSGNFKLKGMVQDSNGVRRLTVTQYKNGNPYPPSTDGVIYDRWNDGGGMSAPLTFHPDAADTDKAASNDWELINLPWDAYNSHVTSDGAYRYEIIATDLSGRVTSPLNRNVTVDTTPPKLGPRSAAPGASATISLTNAVTSDIPPWIGGNATLTGAVSDDDVVTHLHYKIQAEGLPPPGAAGSNADFLAAPDWTSLPIGGGDEDWNNFLNSSALPSSDGGKYKVYVAAFDKAGNCVNNWTAPFVPAYAPFEFGFDAAAPDVAGITLNRASDGSAFDSGTGLNTGFAIKGVVTDGNSLASVTVTQVRKNAAGGTISTFSKALTAGEYTQTSVDDNTSWDLNVPNLPWEDASYTGSNQTDLNSHAYDGVYTYTITVKDVSGIAARISTRELTVVIDTTGPVITVSGPEPDAPVGGVNGNKLPIYGEAIDNLTPAGVAVFYLIDSSSSATPGSWDPSTPTVPPTSWTSAPGGANWNKNVDLTGSLGTEGERYVHIVAYDKVGNRSDISHRRFYADLNPPFMAGWNTPGVEVINGNNYATGTYSLRFTARDTNKLADVEVFENGDKLTTEVSVSKTDDQNWTVTVTRSGMTDATYSYSINIVDITGKTNALDNLPGVSADAHKNFKLRVDTTPPKLGLGTAAAGDAATIGLTNPDTSTGFPWIGSNDALKGIVSDNDGVTYVHYKIQAATALAPDATAADRNNNDFLGDSGWTSLSIQSGAGASVNWNSALDPTTALSNEGKYKVYVAAFDEAGNRVRNWLPPAFPAFGHNYAPFEFGFDAAAPDVTGITLNRKSDGSGAPFDSGTGLNTGFAIKGVVTDANSLDSVTVTQVKDGLATINKSFSLGVGNTSWTLDVQNLPWKDATDGTTDAELATHAYDGVYTYTITVKDVTGLDVVGSMNRTSTLTHTVVVDTTGPVITVLGPEPDAPVGGVNGNRLSISGTAIDDLTPAEVAVFYLIDSSSSATPGPWDPSTPTVPPGSWTSAPGGANWNKNVDLTGFLSPEGERYVHIVAYDTVGNRSAISQRRFYADLNPPFMTGWSTTNVTVINGINYATGTYSFTFTAEDSNALKDADTGVAVEVLENGTRLPNAANAGAAGVWVVKQPDNKNWAVTVNRSGMADATYSYSINIVDITGKTNALDNNTSIDTTDDHKNFTLRVDTTPPKLGPGTAAAGDPATIGLTSATLSSGFPWIGSNDALKGTVWDNDGVTYLHYKIQAATALAPDATAADRNNNDFLSDSGWTSLSIQKVAGADVNWNSALDPTTALPNEGKYKVYVAAFDEAGNRVRNWLPPAPSAPGYNYAPFEFGFDAAAPDVTGITLNRGSNGAGASFSSGTGLNTGFAIKGVVTDTNSLDSVTVTQVKDGLATINKSFSLGVGNTSWTLDVQNLPWKDATDGTTDAELATHAYDGVYTYTITVKDVTGLDVVGSMNRTSTLTHTVVVDTRGPALTVVKPSNGASVGGSGTDLAISGTAVDILTPVDVAVFYQYDTNATGTAPGSPPVPGNPPTLTGWTYVGGGWSADVDMTSLLGTEGTYYLHVIAYDTVGNPSAVVTRLFTVDTAPPYMENWATPTGITTVGGTTYAKAGYSFTFDARDTNALADADTGVAVEVIENGVRLPVAASAGDPGVHVNKTNTKTWAVTVTRSTMTDNDYSYVINITDVAGKENALDNVPGTPADAHKKFTLKVDTTRPRLGPNTAVDTDPAVIGLTNAVVSGGVPWIGGVDALKGTVWDNDGVTTLYYTVGNSVPSHTLDTLESVFSGDTAWKSQSIQSSSAMNTDWNIALDPSAAPISGAEGKYKVYVAAFDKAGNQINNWTPPLSGAGQYYAPFEFGFDAAAPNVAGITLHRKSDGSGTSFSSGTGLNTGFAITGVVTDTHNLASVEVTQTRTDTLGAVTAITKTLGGPDYGQTAPGYDTSWTLHVTDLPWKDATNGTTQTELDTHNYDGVYTYTITVKDVTGITALNMLRTAVRELTVIVDTTGPTLSVTAPAIGAGVNSATLFISGTAQDDLTPADVAVFYYTNATAAAAPSGTWNPAAPTVHPDTDWTYAGGVTWSGNATLGAVEGTNYLHVIAYDALGNKSDVTHRYFTVDKNPPVIDPTPAKWITTGITLISTNNYAQAAYSITFDATDTNALDTPNGVVVTETKNGVETTLTAAPNATAAGVWIVKEPDDKRWHVTVNRSGQTDGVYQYTLKLKDRVGKENTTDPLRTYTVTVDTVAPTVSITREPQVVIANSRFDNINGVIRFSATGGDDNGIASVKWFLIPKNPTNNGLFNPAGTDDPDTLSGLIGTIRKYTGTPGFPLDVYQETAGGSGLTDLTEYILYVLAVDRTGLKNSAYKTYYVDQSTDKPVITLSGLTNGAVVGGGKTFEGRVTDDDGVDTTAAALTAEFSSDNGATWTAGTVTVSGSGRDIGFNVTIPYGSGDDGAKKVRVNAKDDPAAKIDPVGHAEAAIPADQLTLDFTVDTVRPVITFADPADASYAADFTLTGAVTELHPAQPVAAWFRARIDAGTWSYITAPGTGAWTYTVNSIDFAALAQGAHTITLEATDQVGLTAEAQWRFYKDTVGPAITYGNITGEVIPDGDITNPTVLNAILSTISDTIPVLRGSFVDDYSDVAVTAASVLTAGFQYNIDNTGWTNVVQTGVPTDVPNVTGAGRNVQWSVPLVTLGDGGHVIKLKVADKVGNIRESPWIGFKISGQPPKIFITGPNTGGHVYNTIAAAGNVFTLTGYGEDASITKVTVSLDGSSLEQTYTTITPTPTTRILFNYDIAKASFDTLTEGEHTITVLAEKPGKTATQDWIFVKDTVSPVNTLSNVEAGGTTIFMDANPRILGVTEDANGISKIRTVIEKSSDGTPGGTWTTVTDTKNEAAYTVPYPKIVNWTKGLGPTPGTGELTGGIAAQDDGLYRISVTAMDASDVVNTAAAPTQVLFRIDRSNPVLTIGTVKDYYNADAGNITITGTAMDLNGIAQVRAWLDPGNGTAAVQTLTITPTPHASLPNTYEWTAFFDVNTAPFNALPEGSYSLNVEATDGAGRVKSGFKSFTYDKTAPTAGMQDPLSLSRVNGAVTIRGTSNDNFALARIDFLAGKFISGANVWNDTGLGTTSLQPKWAGGLYSWTYEIKLEQPIESLYANKTYSYRVNPSDLDGDGIPKHLANQDDTNFNFWLFPFNVRAYDRAGNSFTTTYYLLIDPDMDNPFVQIISHKNGDLVGGEVRLSGIATDDDWIWGVDIRVSVDNGATWIKGPAEPTADADGWKPATMTSRGAVASWYTFINSTGYIVPPAGSQQQVVVQARTRDSKDNGLTAGDKESLTPHEQVTIYFDSEIPVIYDVEIDREDGTPRVPYAEGLQVSKTFTVHAKIRDESGLFAIQYRLTTGSYLPNVIDDATHVTPPTALNVSPGVHNLTLYRKYLITAVSGGVQFPGASTNTVGETFVATGTTVTGGTGTVLEASGGTLTSGTTGADQNFVYAFEVSVNTLSSHPDTTGYYTLSIQGVDNSMYRFQTQRILDLQVDNYYPSGAYTGLDNLTDANFYIRGSARDFGPGSGNIQGLSHVTMYFSRETTGLRGFIPLDKAGLNHTAQTTFNGRTQYVKNMANGGVLENVTFPNDAGSGITIDKNNEVTGGLSDQDGDGYVEAWYDEGADRMWYAIFDTRQIDDGPVRLHYVIFDNAGNATYYEKDLFIRNHAPKITEVTLGTSIYGLNPETTTDGTKSFTVNYLTTGFTARNRYLTFKLNKLAGSGNGTVRYRITHAARSTTDADSLVSGEVYTIVTPGTTNWIDFGAPDNLAGTTFAAARGSGTAGSNGNGTVAAYTPSGVTKTGTFSVDTTANIVYSRTDFGSIPDTGVDGSFFIIKVWDSTVPPGDTNEAIQLFDKIVVGLRVDNDDQDKPAAQLYDVNPNARNMSNNSVTTLTNAGPASIGSNILLGGLYMTGSGTAAAISGHVEPRGAAAASYSSFLEKNDADQYVPSPNFSQDAVSGKVILRGYASDNQRITAIVLNIGGTAVTIADTNTGTGRLKPVGGTVVSWVYDELTLEGHKAEWAYVWDTQTLPSGIVGAVTVRAIARDARIPSYGSAPPYTITPNESDAVNQGPGTAAPPAANNLNYNSISLNRVPYMTGLVTALTSAMPSNPSTFNRSALGLYPVRDNETITINGFNFNGTSTTVKVGSVTLSGVSSVSANTQIKVPMTASTVSGPLVLTVSSVESVNNKNSNTASYNREANGMNNSTLTDNRELYLWNMNYLVNSDDLTNPFMRMGPDSRWYMSYGRGSDTMYFNLNAAEQNYLEQCYNKYHNTTVAFDSSGEMYGAATNTDRISNTIHQATSFTFYSRGRGNEYSGVMAHYYEGTNKRRLELSYNGSTDSYNIRRVEIPRIAVTGAGTPGDPAKIYMSYFDGNNTASPVVFRYGTSTAANTLTGGFANDLTNNNPGTAAGAQVVANTGTTYKGGLYTAVGGLSTGRAVIAWYDADAKQLVYSYSQGTDPSGTTTAQWQANAKVIDTDFAGWHVDLTVDRNNGIHIAYYTSSNGDLKYAYVPSYDAAQSAIKVVTVDSFLSAGTKLMINTRQETRGASTVIVPYISYYHASFPQTRNSVRIAWRNDFSTLADGAVADDFTGAWEAMTVPAPNVPVEDFVSVGVPSSGTFNNPGGSGVNLTNSVLVGYYTNRWYERAYIKK